jgi:hypothetical protein
VARLESIKFLGFWGQSFWQRAFSFANGGVRRIVASEAVLKLVAQSSTCAELFDALGVPVPEDALDSMT